MSTQTWWYVARSGGIVAWFLLAISTFWGVALSSRFLGKRPKPNWMLDLHRFCGGLATIFTLVHIGGLVADTYVHIGWAETLLPFASGYHRVAVAWGVVAFYLLLSVELTSLVRNRLSKRLWRAVHYLSFPLFALATVHLLWVGTDRHTFLLRYGTLLAVVIVCAATLIRIAQADGDEPKVDRLAAVRRPTS
jgi:DMSO/TMAO reductase YedYZ heme-binding membrane subunit